MPIPCHLGAHWAPQCDLLSGAWVKFLGLSWVPIWVFVPCPTQRPQLSSMTQTPFPAPCCCPPGFPAVLLTFLAKEHQTWRGLPGAGRRKLCKPPGLSRGISIQLTSTTLLQKLRDRTRKVLSPCKALRGAELTPQPQHSQASPPKPRGLRSHASQLSKAARRGREGL